MPKKSVVDEQESPVRSWQLDATQKQVDRHEQIINSFDMKLDTIITQQTKLSELVQSRPTMEQVDQKIEVQRIQLQNDIKNAIEKQDLKYSPIVGNNKWLLGLLLTSGLGLFGSLIFIAIGLSK